MQYLLLIYDQEAKWDAIPAAEQQKIHQRYGVFSEELRAAGKLLGANQLQPISAATTVRVRDGKKLVTDGPFAETKEQLGGYYLVEAKDLDEALSLAARIPSAEMGSVEVRPIVERHG